MPDIVGRTELLTTGTGRFRMFTQPPGIKNFNMTTFDPHQSLFGKTMQYTGKSLCLDRETES